MFFGKSQLFFIYSIDMWNKWQTDSQLPLNASVYQKSYPLRWRQLFVVISHRSDTFLANYLIKAIKTKTYNKNVIFVGNHWDPHNSPMCISSDQNWHIFSVELYKVNEIISVYCPLLSLFYRWLKFCWFWSNNFCRISLIWWNNARNWFDCYPSIWNRGRFSVEHLFSYVFNVNHFHRSNVLNVLKTRLTCVTFVLGFEFSLFVILIIF